MLHIQWDILHFSADIIQVTEVLSDIFKISDPYQREERRKSLHYIGPSVSKFSSAHSQHTEF